MKTLGLIVSLCWIGALSGNIAEAQQIPAGKTVPEKANGLTVWVFLALDCPISQKYISELKRIDSVYSSSQVQIKAVIPGNVNQIDIDSFWQEYNIPFAAIPDPGFTWVSTFKAKITPEVFLTNQQNQIFYRGAIDNWFFDLGKYRQKITRHYLTDAIEAVVQHRKPEIPEMEAVGCPIQVNTTAKAKK